ncbi:MAG: hypothetical protein ACRER0_01170 [Gammaproteobacteria bacterium]
MYIKTALIGITVLGLAACASTPTARFASSVEAAKAANRPIVIYQFATFNRFASHGHYPSFPVYGTLAGLSFINTAQVPINKVVFTISSTTQDQKPVTGDLIALGDFTPGSSYSVVSRSPLWNSTSVYPCPRLTGITVFYQDGSSVDVKASNTAQYLTSQINIHCANNISYTWGLNSYGPTDMRPMSAPNPVGHGG